MKARFKASELVKGMVMNVEIVGVKRLNLRFKIGAFLIKLAAKLIGVQIRIGLNGEDNGVS